ncbi:MAG: FxLYD domain-containing protein [Candidatus Aquicultorales bacterium]
MKSKLTALVVIALLLFGGTALAANKTQAKRNVKKSGSKDLHAADKKKKMHVAKEQSDKRTKQDKKLEIVSVGATQAQDEFVTVGVLIKNPNKTKLAEQLTVAFMLLDENDEPLGTAEELLLSIPANSQAVVGLEMMVSPDDARAESIDVDVSWKRLTTQKKNAPYFRSDNLVLTEDSEGTHVTGDMTNPFDTTYDNLRIYGVFFDKSGEIVGGDFADIENVGAGDTFPFEVYADFTGLEATEARVFANPVEPAE